MTNGRGGNIVTMEVMTKEQLKRSENDKGINDAVQGRQANVNSADRSHALKRSRGMPSVKSQGS